MENEITFNFWQTKYGEKYMAINLGEIRIGDVPYENVFHVTGNHYALQNEEKLSFIPSILLTEKFNNALKEQGILP